MQNTESRQEPCIREIPLKQEIITVKESDSVQTTLNLMHQENIRSVGVCSDNNESLLGLVSVFDIMTLIFFSAFDPSENPKPISAKPLEKRIGDIVSVFHEDTERVWEFDEKQPISVLFDILAQGYHQAVINTDEGKKKLLSQYDLVKFFCDKKYTFEEQSKTLQELGYGKASKPFEVKCTSVDSSCSTLHCFRKMEAEQYPALPVVDSKTGAIIATISASDVRGITMENLNDALKPVLEFLENMHGTVPPPLTCKVTETLGEVMNRLIETKHRHIWVVNDEGKHIDSVSLTDVISYPDFTAFLTRHTFDISCNLQ